MSIQGTGGNGNQFVGRFASGDVISASQLNDIINGLSTTITQPYLGAGPNISFGSGGTIITTSETDQQPFINLALNINFDGEKVDHWEIGVVLYDTGGGILGAALKVAKGGNIWRPSASECPTELLNVQIVTDGTLTVVPGANPNSPWAANDGHIVIEQGVTYYVYAFKLETSVGSTFYAYVSTSAALLGSCPPPVPTGIMPPVGIDYDFKGLLVGTATVVVPFNPIVQQFILGSITWPNLGTAGTEYVNHYETAVKTMTIGDTPTKVLKVGRGGNIWNPSPSTDQKPLEKRADVITTDPAFGITVAGMDVNSPWASDDGYVELAGVSAYVYAFKVISAGGAVTDFYIYVSGSSTLVDGSPVTLPAGITPPTGPYTVQGLRVADAVWNGISSDFDVSQRVVGSITWPDYVPPRVVQQFECVVESLPTESGFVDGLRIAKGDILWSYAPFTSSAHDSTPLQGHAKKLWVYPTGSLTSDVNPALPWVNGGGYVTLDREQTYGVYIIGNQDSAFFGGAVSLAVIANGSDAAAKTRPFRSGYMGRGWESVFSNGLTVDGSLIYSPFYQFDRLKNYNCQRYLVATLAWGGSAWSITQYLYGPVTLSQDLDNAGPHVYDVDPPPTDFQTEQDAWNGAWSGSTKDGNPADCTDIVWVS